MKKLVNLTPHSINLVLDEETITISPSGLIARVKEEQKIIGEVNNIPVVRVSYSNVENLPAPEKDTIYIVSSIVANAVKDRDDIYIVANTVRDEQGRIIGAKNLAKI